MPQLTVKTKYIEKLKQLGVYDAWLADIHNEPITPADKKCMYDSVDFCEFLGASFIWIGTKEGSDFWYEVSQK